MTKDMCIDFKLGKVFNLFQSDKFFSSPKSNEFADDNFKFNEILNLMKMVESSPKS